jgi:O-acetyl-ADP-ribose deacetylase (regulator of RNase III)
MITYVKGNLLESNAEALVNTVNTEGVMGKGLALQFREAFPANYRVYRDLCRNRRFHVGEMLITEESNLISGRKLIVNFPTKTSWRLPSEYTYIEKGLVALRREILRRQIRSIAIPPLGTHNGGLDWLRVKQMIESALSDLDCEILLYEPSEVIVERMKSERVPLTPARAMVLVMFADLIANGEFASVFAAEKLIYFMQRFGAKEYFKIDFKPYIYGPYSGGKVSHILYHMNGSYIKGMGGMDNRPFDYIWLIDGAAAEADAFVRGHEDQKLLAICDRTKRFLTGYYSNYSLELLATVDYLLETSPSLKNWRNDNLDTVLNTLEQKIQEWSNRKSQMFHRSLLVTALDYLRERRMN